ncbi:DGQHR domain-containing protein [Oscillatoriales cyanobacterium LEGE 11467]|uniref:DGQHR domain-containing protein n=1 Tax=Zarconia navalis LEGE 11467 TaxID=1828826 RepID=A0A928VUZ1_9CYAN|nr:DGQHR domain-containing protein [Zarconia navalis]MBE9040626.1 DGQHR domain-containing protein [Zarconia navalis LEGE 11467]
MNAKTRSTLATLPRETNENRLFVQTTQMGGTAAYLSSVTLEWLDRRVGFASELPLFQPHLDRQTQNVERGAHTLESIVQRPLDWSRQAPLAQYLATRTAHKFPPLLVVLSPAWVDEPDAPQWNWEGRAIQSAAEFLPLDEGDRVGWLEVSPEVQIYALDGQHRLMGVQGLMELLRSGELQPYNKLKKTIGQPIALADIVEKYGIDAESLQCLGRETLGVEFIPAVLPGETREEARRRVRSIFVHVNLMAVPLSKGQLALLDEDDGFSIVTRQVAAIHPLLREEEGRNPRVNWDSATVAAKSTVLTTLQALKEMAARYLEPQFPHWSGDRRKGLIPRRPEDNELQAGVVAFSKLLDGFANLPSYQELEHQETTALRRFSFEEETGRGNLLFRPVGQIVLAQALGGLVSRSGLSLETIFDKLQRYDGEGGFDGMESPRSLWYGVLYDPNKRRVRVAGRDLAAKLLIYILGGAEDRMERAQLRKALAQARTFENKAVSFQGRFVQPKEVGLPEVL